MPIHLYIASACVYKSFYWFTATPPHLHGQLSCYDAHSEQLPQTAYGLQHQKYLPPVPLQEFCWPFRSLHAHRTFQNFTQVPSSHLLLRSPYPNIRKPGTHCHSRGPLSPTHLSGFVSVPCTNVYIQKTSTLNGVCDVVIYNKKYIFGLHPIPATEFLKPLEFPE